MSRLYPGDLEIHPLGPKAAVIAMPMWDDHEIVEVRVRATGRAGDTVKRLPAQEAATWLSLTWPSHFRRDGTCRCEEPRP